ncbi:MAG: ATP synthase F1 subunit gamma [Coriobacteriia bacterium]|nr:ATP synthase F1 subunit gamma [Coriobacteriia bacterium]
MANLRDIKKRITSVNSTRQITRTMEMVSTAKIKKAQERIEAARPYALAMMELLGNVTRYASGAQHPLLEIREERRRVVAISVTSDRGLAGAFNSNILKLTEEYLRDAAASGSQVDLVTVGKKAASYFLYRGVTPIAQYRDISSKPTFADAKAIANQVIRAYSDAEIDEVVVLFNRFVNVADQSPELHKLLPISSTVLEDAAEKSDVSAEYLFEPGPEDVLGDLLPSYVEALIFRALMESAAAEHGARRKAMKSATDNASEMIVTLTRTYNRARQAAITTEISEIIGGAAALED